MAQYSNLKAYIEEKIYENGTQAITGDILQDVLKVMTDDLGEFYQMGGVASPSTDPGTPDAKVIYIATEAGTYTNFGGITLEAGEVALLIFETSWTKETLNVLSAANGGVKTANLADGAVTTEKIAGGAVETAKIANNAVTSGKVADGAIGTAKIADGAIDADKIAANAVESAKIKNGAVTEGKINDGAVTAGKIASNAVTTAKIADDAVTTAKLNDGAVTEDKIATDAVTSGKVKDGAIGTAKIAAGAVTHAKIGAGAVEESNIKDGAVTSDKIADGAVGSDQLAEGAFSAENLADGSVTTEKLADDAVTAEKIADGAVTAGKFANGSVTTIKLGSGAVTTEKIGDGMVTRQKLADSSVGTSKIIDRAVTTDKVADGAITDAKLENPVSVSQNTLSIGGEYKGEVSTTYDVTLHSGQTFADLSALLSNANLNTLIPIAVRKGGMSIKFVQTSDNKYVQYRLTSQTFNTTINNWHNEDIVAAQINCQPVCPFEPGGIIAGSDVVSSAYVRTKSGIYNPVSSEMDVYIDCPASYNIAVGDIYFYNNGTYVRGTGFNGRKIHIVPDGTFNQFRLRIEMSNATTAETDKIFATYLTRDAINLINKDIQALNNYNKSNIFFNEWNRGTLYLEEDTTNGYVFLKYIGSLYVSAIASKHYTLSELATELGVSLVTSTKGVTDCLMIPNISSLCFNSVSATMVIKNREQITVKDILLISQSSGTIIYINQGLKNIVSAYETEKDVKTLKDIETLKTTGQFYIDGTNRPLIDIEEDTANLGRIFFTYKGTLYVRCTSADKGLTISQLATELNTSLITSPYGMADSILLDNTRSLCFNVLTNKFEIVLRTGVKKEHIVILANTGGKVLYIHPNMYNLIDLRNILKDGWTLFDRYNNINFLTIRDNILNGADFSALFLSDIHGSDVAAKRIVSLANLWKSKINAVIDGGDDVASYIDDNSIIPLNTTFATCQVPILRVVGNHDAWKSAVWDWATNQEIYNIITSPMVSQLSTLGKSVTQPSDVATEFENYYYYDEGNVRVIVLCCSGESSGQYWNAAQKLWFENVLANSSGKTVLCVNHGIFAKSNSVPTESAWNTFYDWSVGEMPINSEALDAVDTFIANGGNFVGWIGGHTHCDVLVKTKEQDYIQLGFATGSACIGVSLDGKKPTNERAAGYDLFNILAIDITRHFIKVYRLGFNTNYGLQVHNSFVWDYVQRKLIASN